MKHKYKFLTFFFSILLFTSVADAKSKYIWDKELDKLPLLQQEFVVDIVKAYRESDVNLATSRLHSSTKKNVKCLAFFKSRFEINTIQEQYAVKVKPGRKPGYFQFSIRDQKKNDGSKRNFFKMKNVVLENDKLVIKMNCKAAARFEKREKAKKKTKAKFTAKPKNQTVILSASNKILGNYKLNKSTMPIKDTVYFIEEAKKKLIIIQTPSKLTLEEKKRLKAGENHFMVLLGKDSPNPKLWSWYPYTMTELTFKSDEISASNIKNFYIMAYGIEKKNHTSNFNSSPSNKYNFKKVEIKNGKLSAEFSGSRTSMDSDHSWNLTM